MIGLHKVKELVLGVTEMIFDLKYHPEKDSLLACATVEGDVLM